jgi:uncharacterized protein (UPF0332 family)
MGRIIFLARLHDENKLISVEPSDNVKKAYLQRSNESLSSAKALYKIGNLKDSVALAYYSMYHCLLALLFRAGIKSENHSASILLLKDVFGLDNSAISKAKKERIDKQYYVDFEIGREETLDAIRTAERFVSEMTDYISRMTESDIKKYRDLFLSLSK